MYTGGPGLGSARWECYFCKFLWWCVVEKSDRPLPADDQIAYAYDDGIERLKKDGRRLSFPINNFVYPKQV